MASIVLSAAAATVSSYPTPVSCQPPWLFHQRQPPKPYDSLDHYLLKSINGYVLRKPDFISAMKACAFFFDVPLGRAIHARIAKSGLGTDRYVATALIPFYSSCGLPISARQLFDAIQHRDAVLMTTMLVGLAENGNISDARRLFDEIPVKDSAAWNAMMSCYLQCGFPEKTLDLFREMQISDIRTDEVTVIVALSACSRLGCLTLGEWIHVFVQRVFSSHESSTLISNALMHMYSKCGLLDFALQIFIRLEVKSLESWNTLLTGFAVHGFAGSCLSLFSQMIRNGVPTDRITLLALLMACSHAGKVAEAVRIFIIFTEVYGVRAGTEHYGCLVDALCRRGQLEEASKLIDAMPVEVDASVWGALLRGCISYQNYELGLEAAKRLLELEPYDRGRYVALSKLVVMNGEVEDERRVRKMMADLGNGWSPPGVSMIEIGGDVHEFLYGDASHAQSANIYAAIDSIHLNMGILE